MHQKCINTQPNKDKNIFPQYTATISVCIGSLAAGAAIAWTGNISDDMKSKSYNGIEIDDDSLGWIGSLLTLGMTASCIPLGLVCDAIGRKTSVLSVIIPFIIGSVLTLYASSLVTLYIGRFIIGMAASAFIVVAPIYITEIVQKDIRGALGSYLDLFLTIGHLLGYCTPMIVDMTTHTYIIGSLPLIFAVCFAFQPESPIFLIRRNRIDEARAILTQLRGKNYDISVELNDALKIKKTSVFTALKQKGTRRATMVCFGLMFFQAMTGIYPILMYTDTIFKTSGVEINPKTATIVIGVTQVIGEAASCLLADRISRRVLLMLSNLLVAISVSGMGLFLTLSERLLVAKSIISVLDFMPIVSLSIFAAVFSLGMGPIPWVINSELFPTEIKGPAMGATAMFNSLISFVTSKLFFYVSDSVGSDINYYIYSVVSFVGVVFIYFYLPETRRKTLDEIQNELNL